jgi:hypothetical protein
VLYFSVLTSRLVLKSSKVCPWVSVLPNLENTQSLIQSASAENVSIDFSSLKKKIKKLDI